MPINFKLTASSVMNSFYVPALAGMIYTMPGMQTKLHAVINKPGEFEGLSSNYSGDGFSHMRFKFHGLDQAGFDAWVAKVKQNGTMLNRDTYLKLEKPSEKEPVRYYAGFENGLFDAVLNMCVRPGSMCMKDMMHIDMMGGGGIESHENKAKLEHDNRHASDEGLAATHPATGEEPRSDEPAQGIDDTGKQPDATNHDMDDMNKSDAVPDEGKTDPAPAQLHDHN
jgi:cytochrome o ubiquinol oxidase subunit 2